MSYADQVRAHCLERYVQPARQKGSDTISIRSGDVHSEMGYSSRMPLVCSAIGSNKFEEMACLKRLVVEGPLNGANTNFIFKLL